MEIELTQENRTILVAGGDIILSREEATSVIEGGEVLKSNSNGTHTITLCGMDNGRPLFSSPLTTPTEKYNEDTRKENEEVIAQRESQEIEIEQKKSDVLNLTDIINSKIESEVFDNEYFSALGRHQLLTREVIL